MVSRPIARRAAIAALICWLGLGWGPARAETPPPLEIAVLPFFSTRLLIETYEPLRAAVEARLGRPTYLVTAPDFRTFARKTQAGRYGFIITAPHLGRLAELEAGYRPMLQWESPLQGVFLTGKASPVGSLAELRGRAVGTPDPLAVITMLGMESLAAAGLAPGTDVQLSAQPSHNAALLSVLRGETAAALTWTNTLATIDPEIRDQVRPLAYTTEMRVALVFMAGPHLDVAEEKALHDALLSFADSQAGRAFMRHGGYRGIGPVARGELAAYDRFLPLTRRLLGDEPGRP